MRSFERTWWASLARSDLLNAEDAWLQASGTQNQARRPKLTHHDLIISRNRHRPIIAVFDVPDPGAAPAITGVVIASGALHNVELKRLLTQDEVIQIRHTASKLRGAYKPPGK